MGEYQSHWIQGSSQFKILWDRENTKVCVAGGEIKFLKVKFFKLMPWLVNGVKQLRHEDRESPDKGTVVCDQDGVPGAFCRASAPVSVCETPKGDF